MGGGLRRMTESVSCGPAGGWGVSFQALGVPSAQLRRSPAPAAAPGRSLGSTRPAGAGLGQHGAPRPRSTPTVDSDSRVAAAACRPLGRQRTQLRPQWLPQIRQRWHIGDDREFQSTPNTRNEMMLKEAGEFAAHLKRCEKDIRALKNATEGRHGGRRGVGARAPAAAPAGRLRTAGGAAARLAQCRAYVHIQGPDQQRGTR